MNLENDVLSALSLRLLETLMHFLWQGAALALLAATLMLLTRAATARTRYALLTIILALTAAAPIATLTILASSPSVPHSSAFSRSLVAASSANPPESQPHTNKPNHLQQPSLTPSPALEAEPLTATPYPARSLVAASSANPPATPPHAQNPNQPPHPSPTSTPALEAEPPTATPNPARSLVAASSANPPATPPHADNPAHFPQPSSTPSPALEAEPTTNNPAPTPIPSWVPASSASAHEAAALITKTLTLIETQARAHATTLTLAYLLGVALMLLRLAWALHGGRRLRRRAIPVTDTTLLDTLRNQARILGLRAAPAVAYCERVAVPTVIGVVRPMILLPLFMVTGFTPAQLELILRHELAHIRRYDHLINLLQRLIEAFLFFHPGVWYISRQIRIEREHCCDDLVLATGGEALAYADSLVRIAEQGLGKEHLAAVHMAARPSDLRRRIIRLLEGPAPHLRITRLGLTIALMLLIGTGAALHAATRDTAGPNAPALAQNDPPDQSDPSDLPNSLSPSTPPEHPTPEEFSQLLEKLQDVERKLGELAQKLEQAERPMPTVPEPTPHPETPAHPPILEPAPIAPAPELPLESIPEPGVPDMDIDSLPTLTEEVRSQLRIPDFDINMLQPRTESRPEARAIINLKPVAVGQTIPDTPLIMLAVEMNRIAVQHTPTGQQFVLPFGFPAEMKPTVEPPAPADSWVASDPSVPSAPFDLISQLQDEDWWLRKIAAQQMADTENPNVGMLINALKDKDPRVQAAAAESLGTIANDRAIKHLVAALKEEDPVRTAAAEALANFDTAQTLDLIKLAAADTENLDVQVGAVAALKKLPGDVAVPILVDMLNTVQSGDEIVSDAIFDALAQAPPDTAHSAFTQLAQFGSPIAATTATRLLEVWNTDASREALVEIATNPKATARAVAIEILGGISGDTITQTLVELLDDPTWEIRVASANALEKRSYFPQTPEEQANYYVPLENWEAVRNLGAIAIDPLLAALAAPFDEPRRAQHSRTTGSYQGFSYQFCNDGQPSTQAALILANLGAREATEPITRLLAHDSDIVGMAAAAALLILNDPAAEHSLVEALRTNPHASVRYNALQALHRLATPESVDAIIAALQDPHAFIRAAAAEALGDLKTETALDPLIQTLNDVDESVTGTTMTALASIGGPVAVEAVASELGPDNDEQRREYAARLLGQMGPNAVPHLIKALNDENEKVQAEAMTALGQIGDPIAIEPVAAFLAPDKPEDWQRFAAETLGKLGPQAIPHLEAFLNRPDPEPEPSAQSAPRRSRPAHAPKQAAQDALQLLKQSQQGDAPTEP